MVERIGSKNHNQTLDVSIDQQRDSKHFDDDGRVKRTGGFQVQLCGLVQYLNLVGVAIGYTIASAISMM
ncbi:hypothetical protein TSUD_376290 [Trifolium subterraneum]|uniref:Amino acid transporter transmembrane domain-containing protein n=1 Tax=Trifolium subterraneum TaxID=3900 RepID=A0A2Z6MQR6_TRISU|nr:hypothetical protein TSUD_376290 [Trifolium subterraneum]